MYLFWTNFHCFSVRFSPFPSPDGPTCERAAVGTSQYFGLAGNGRLHVLNLAPEAGWQAVRRFDTPEGIYDCAWNESNERQVVVACADGTIRLFDTSSPDPFPVQVFAPHAREASACSWGGVDKRLFATGSWDQTVRVYDPSSPNPVASFAGQGGSVNGVEWHPTRPRVVASAGDRSVALWDMAVPSAPVARFNVSPTEVIALDWSKYREHEVATAGNDTLIRIWDTRAVRYPIKALAGHTLPVRRLRYSPHDPDVIASASYDRSVAFWNAGAVDGPSGPELSRARCHREFACGVDFSLFHPGLVASVGWDQSVIAWDHTVSTPPLVPPVPAHIRMTVPGKGPVGGSGGGGGGGTGTGVGGAIGTVGRGAGAAVQATAAPATTPTHLAGGVR
jgi:peroxin-7